MANFDAKNTVKQGKHVKQHHLVCHHHGGGHQPLGRQRHSHRWWRSLVPATNMGCAWEQHQHNEEKKKQHGYIKVSSSTCEFNMVASHNDNWAMTPLRHYWATTSESESDSAQELQLGNDISFRFSIRMIGQRHQIQNQLSSATTTGQRHQVQESLFLAQFSIASSLPLIISMQQHQRDKAASAPGTGAGLGAAPEQQIPSSNNFNFPQNSPGEVDGQRPTGHSPTSTSTQSTTLPQPPPQHNVPVAPREAAEGTSTQLGSDISSAALAQRPRWPPGRPPRVQQPQQLGYDI